MTRRLCTTPATIAAILLAGLFAVLLAGCSGSTQALDSAAVSKDSGQKSAGKSTAQGNEQVAASEGEKPAEEADETAQIIHKPTTVARKGNYIQVVVNNRPITRYDIQHRIKFRQLRRLKASEQEAIKELIDQELKLEEAERRRMLASDQEVDAAFANFAKSNRATPSKIASDLNGLGVGAKHFKEFIRAQISWSRTVGAKLRSETRENSRTKALFDIRKSGAEKPETTEYTLQQIIFVIPKAKRKELLKARKAEALAFGQRFTGCENSVEMAKGLRDVTVKELGRVLAPEVPQLWSKEVPVTEVGKTAGPKETDFGVELLAVCASRVVSDDMVAQVVTQSNTFESLEEKGSAPADAMLAELRKAAVIIYK